MKFRTEVIPPVSSFQITHQDALALVGSCFSENIGALLLRYRFKVSINSHGILFNPQSISKAIHQCIEAKLFTVDDLLQLDDRLVSLDHHGRFSGSEVTAVLEQINQSILAFHQSLLSAKVLFITFGSAHAYQYQPLGKIVANCHKIPQQHFTKILLQPEQIVETYQTLLTRLKQFNPALNVVFTVSPVRHLRDGAVQNQRSKAHLLTAVHRMVELFDHCSYFPAYEIVMDDLRDYRFFEQDMIHPSKQAITYVWDRLAYSFFSSSTLEKMKQMEPFLKFLEHRDSGSDREEYQLRLTENERSIASILSR